LLAIVLLFGLAGPALAVPPCWPNSPVNVGPGQYLSPTQLLSWWNTYGVPAGVADPHAYVAFQATDRFCKKAYGTSAWAQITGPYTLTSMVNSYNISQGVWFQCKKCPSIVAEPVPEEPSKD
jgi:hypothetical protein